MVYAELRALAHARMRQERKDHTLQATALVHEAYLRLVRDAGVEWESRGHFFAAAAEAMRRILIEHARGTGRAPALLRRAQRRGDSCRAGVAPRTVKRDWTFARAWLFEALGGRDG